MDIVKLAKWKKELIMKAWGKCKSNIGSIKSLSKTKSSKNNDNIKSTTSSNSFKHYLKRSFTTSSNPNDRDKTRRRRRNNNNQVTPNGCFSVYVGPEKQRFVVKTEHANHPLFRMLLEEAESEYGYNSDGPISLPCHVELFNKVLAEMESFDDDDQDGFMMMKSSPVCSLNILCSPLNNRVGSYKRLSPSRFIKMNQF